MRYSSIFTALASALSVAAAPLSDANTLILNGTDSNSTYLPDDPDYFYDTDDDDSISRNKTILLLNDDGWAATNLRATYRELKNVGYDVIVVAPVQQMSGHGGQFSLPTSENLTTGGEFNYPPAGFPSWGHEEDDENIWYFNGTPSSCVAFALNYIIPTYFDNTTIDLVVAGPNEGTNLSPGLYTLSGTIGAIYSAVNRGYPGIAFSGSMTNNSFFKDDVDSEDDPTFGPNILAYKVVELVDALFDSFENRPNLLPITTGINVNFPTVGKDCTDPEWVYSRMTGLDAVTPDLTFNETSGLPVWEYGEFDATTKCVFGDCELPSEAWIISQDNCKSSVTLFSIDYDANYKQTQSVKSFLSSVID